MGVGNLFAQMPDGGPLGGAAGERGIEHEVFFHGFGQHRFELVAQAGVGRSVGQLHPGIVRGAFGQRVERLGKLLQDEFQDPPFHVLEGVDRVVKMAAAKHEQVQGGLHGGDGAKGEREIARARHHLQHRRGDNAQRSLGSDKELAETVSGVVFAQTPQTIPDGAVGQDDLEAKHEVASIAKAHSVIAARVAGEDAANLRRTLRAHGEPQDAAFGEGGFLRGLERGPGVDGQGQVDRVEVANLVHAGERQHDFRAVRAGRGASHHVGIASLGHQGNPLFGA